MIERPSAATPQGKETAASPAEDAPERAVDRAEEAADTAAEAVDAADSPRPDEPEEASQRAPASGDATDPEAPPRSGGVDPGPGARAESADGAERDQQEAADGAERDSDPGGADAGGEGATPPPEPPREDPRLRLLQAEVAKKDELLREYIRAHKKAQAEWDAYRARLKRDEAAHVEAARGKAVEVFLDVADDMERSLSAARQGGTVESLLEGLELVHRRFFRALEELGLEKHDPTGDRFDPETMEAIGMVPVTDEAQDGKVVHTLRIGYRLGDRELRPAVVQVGRKG